MTITLCFIDDHDQVVELARFTGGHAEYLDDDLEDEIMAWPIQPGSPGFVTLLRQHFGRSHRFALRES